MASPSPKNGHAVDASRQKRVGEATRQRSRQRLVLAAAEVFAERGYSGTTVNAIAERAGVSLRTLYLAWGSKRHLLRAYIEYSLSGSPTAVTDGSFVPQLQDLLDPRSASDAHARMRSIATIFRHVAERTGLAWRLLRDGAAVDPGVAEDNQDLQRLRRRDLAGLLEGLHQASLRPELTHDGAIDTLLVIASPGAYETLVEEGGYTMDQFERWIGDTLIAALLSPPPGISTPPANQQERRSTSPTPPA